MAILLYAASMRGKKVRRGECWDVPAVPRMARGFVPAGYDFGKRVVLETAFPAKMIRGLIIWRPGAR